MKTYILKILELINYTKHVRTPGLEISFIEELENNTDILFHINDIKKKREFIKIPSEIYNNKKLLKKFSNKNAAVIGYYHGICYTSDRNR